MGFSKTLIDSLDGSVNVETITFRCLPYCTERIAELAESGEARDALLGEGIVLDPSVIDSFVQSAKLAEESKVMRPKQRQGALGMLDGAAQGTPPVSQSV